MTLKPEDRALIERVLGAASFVNLRDFGQISEANLSSLLDAARSEGDGGRPWAWMKRWTDPQDGPGPNRVRVDTNPTVEAWMQDCTVTPLYERAAPLPVLPDGLIDELEGVISDLESSDWARAPECVKTLKRVASALPALPDEVVRLVKAASKVLYNVDQDSIDLDDSRELDEALTFFADRLPTEEGDSHDA